MNLICMMTPSTIHDFINFVIYLNAQGIGGITSVPPINHQDDLHIDILEINIHGQNLNNIIKELYSTDFFELTTKLYEAIQVM